MKNNLTNTRYIRINGKYMLWDSISEEQKKSIPKDLNEKAMKRLGYKPKE
ncbi:hypothetical protein [Anaeromicropila herbilytica]|uniref:Uncharacterized protein n=1 Tax=Anaeromicropila herbilytica TaxID=2785025 RepID=A0A7R7ICR1_9FIRM|nr:hypothetical protein [Anaeromicropila herbilytica]BCN30141.1 hypothetical protein bsdtb5_14360 [Anaeromicropila herbilytica]